MFKLLFAFSLSLTIVNGFAQVDSVPKKEVLHNRIVNDSIYDSGQTSVRAVPVGGISNFSSMVYKEIAPKLQRLGDHLNNVPEGRVILSFIVNEDASISDLHIEKGLDDKVDKIVLIGFRKVVNGNGYEPGKLDSVPVKTRMRFPVMLKF